MNVWIVAAGVLLVAIAPTAWVAFRGSPMDRLIALELGGTIDALVLVLLAEAFGRDALFDVALLVALLSFAGGLTFVRFMERGV